MTKRRGKVLVVDDEANARNALAELIEEEGYETATAADGRRALELVPTFDPDVILTDLKMPGIDGLELIDRAKPLCPHAAFVVMTAFGSIDTAVEAIKRGAENYLTKPLDLAAVTALVERALEKSMLSREAERLREQVGSRLSMAGILGDHPSMQRVLKVVDQVAKSRATVLISGESGTGKELIAAAIHHRSPRRDRPFVRVNCAALAESLLESELFGHEKGSFTGAVARREGRFEQADGGTLFLDEISEIPLSVQVKLLRFLQQRELERVGGNETLTLDVRVVAATNKDLELAVKAGAFREDLFYRLDVVRIDVPPLRARVSDIPLLAHHFLRKFAAENERAVEGFTDDAIRALMAYGWPGNVRELENAIERAIVLSDARVLDVDAFLRAGTASKASELAALIPGLTLKELERLAIERTLAACNGSRAKTAAMLGISRRTLQYRIKEWNLGDDDDED
jgi:DNA-binding NtrC family response regulator